MARAIWTGAVSFGLVNVPARMYSAVSEHKLHFHYVHEPDGSPIGYEKICKAESRSVPDFVPHEEIDPVFFERSYYLGSEAGAELVYALLARALEQTGLTGIAKFVMRDREYLAALRVKDGVVVLERMHFADEVRSVAEVAPGEQEVGGRELEMAVELVERLAGSFEPEKVRGHLSRAPLRHHPRRAQGRARSGGRDVQGRAGRARAA